MDKLIINSLLIGALISAYLAGASIEEKIHIAADRATLEFRQKVKVGHFKFGVAVLEFTEATEDARKNKVGVALRSIIEDKFNQSRIFTVVSRDVTKKIFEEMELRASGVTSEEGEGKELAIKAVDYLVQGEIAA